VKILIIGGNGTIGKRVVQELEEEHEVIVVGRTSGEVQVDIADSASIKDMFEKVGNIDALICLAGEAKWDTFNSLSEEDFYIGLKSKLMGQVNLVRMGQEYLSKNGSITLTTGILADDPVLMTTSAAMVNGAIHSFVKAVVLELEDIRVNAVCSGLVEDSVAKYQAYFKGHNPVPMKKVVNAYLKSVFGRINGQIIRVYE
jgi:NAD(P)-dependent dehydrogenase (short-subunit alcohol dehydrogenase family)